MSKIINGDITAVAHNGAIVQQVNCQGAMGAGVALAILKKWPTVRPEYIEFCKDKPAEFLFGALQMSELEDGLILYNSFSQLDFGTDKKQTDEDTLIANIHKVADLVAADGQSVYIPYLIGCGLAGGDWDVVYDGIKDISNLIIVKF